MEDDKLIKKLINNYGRNFHEMDRQKLSGSIKFIVKYFFLFLAHPKESKIDNRKFKLHLPSELDNEFKDFVYISSEHSVKENTISFFKVYYLLCLSCIFRKNSMGIFFFKSAYKKIKNQLSDEAIVIVNAGPSFLTQLFSYYCYKNEDSKFYFMQHGIYQLDYEPYVFEKYFDKGLTLMLWSEKLMQNLRKVCKSEMILIPTYKITTISKFNDLKKKENEVINILFVGESLNKVNKEYDKDYLQKILEVKEQFNKRFNHCVFYFKAHPNMLNKQNFCNLVDGHGIKTVSNLKNLEVEFAVAHASTFLFELLSKGVRCFQMKFKVNDIKLTDYSEFSSIVPIEELSNEKNSMDSMFEKNYIDKDYLLVNPNYKKIYEEVVVNDKVGITI